MGGLFLISAELGAFVGHDPHGLEIEGTEGALLGQLSHGEHMDPLALPVQGSTADGAADIVAIGSSALVVKAADAAAVRPTFPVTGSYTAGG